MTFCYEVTIRFPAWGGMRANSKSYYISASKLSDATVFFETKYPEARVVEVRRLGILETV